MTNYLTKRQMSTYKGRLTRAQKKGPQAVHDTVVQTFREWDQGDYAWPDAWHTWNIAYQDACLQLGIQPTCY